MSVLVVGNAVLDLAYAVERLPLPGETVVARSKRVEAGGKALNQAVAARRAGAEVRFCGPLAEDAGAEAVRRRLVAEGLSLDLVWRHTGPTDESLILVAATGETAIVSTAGTAHPMAVEAGLAAIDRLGPGDLLVIQGNLERVTSERSLAKARKRGARTLLNPSPVAFDHQGLWPLVDIVVANAVEAAQLMGENGHAAAEALARAGVAIAVVTQGAEGAWLAEAGRAERVRAPSVAAVDTTGAGDVLVGVLAAGLDQGLSPRTALRWAVAAASLSVTRDGTITAFPTQEELTRLRAEALGSL